MRPSATIVLLACTEWELTRACLETLRPTIGVRDQVVVVDNGSNDGTSAALARYRWVQVVTQTERLSFAAGRNSGAAVATGEVVVFLDSGTLLPSRWLDGLLTPFADAEVAAAGPRSNVVAGAQHVEDVPYAGGTTADLMRFARDWRQQHRGQAEPATGLAAFCLAVRRSVFESLGGFHERVGADEDLCARMAASGHRLLIAQESFVHQHGDGAVDTGGARPSDRRPDRRTRRAAARRRQGRPAGDAHEVLLSACMIVKDEEDNLPECLAALDGIVDEIVVYDTGSTDRTVEIARAAGATVLEGYWDDDFGRARNVALDACQGAWVLHVDADEFVEGDPATVRRQLRGPHAPDAFTVSIGNVGDDGQVEVWHNAIRLFRRGRARWSGRLHEQLVATSGVLTGEHSSLLLRHTGYTSHAVSVRGKMERNLRVAQRAVQEEGDDDAASLINLGRSLSGAGRTEEALQQFSLARSLAVEGPLQRHVLRFGAEALLQLGRHAEALTWIEELRQTSPTSTMPDYLEGLARLNLADPTAALRCFERIGHGDHVADEDLNIPAHFVAIRRGVALLANEKWQEAAEVLVSALPALGLKSAPWTLLLEAHVRAGLALDDLLALDPDVRTVHVLGHAVKASAMAGQALATHLWERGREADRLPVVAFLPQLTRQLGLEDTLSWSVRLRAVGLTDQCPLADFAVDADRPALERLKAAAVLSAALSDPRGAAAMEKAASDIEDRQVRSALVTLDELAPLLLPSFLTLLVGDRRRVPAVAAALTDLGAAEQAELLWRTYAA